MKLKRILTTDALKDEYRYRYLPENSEIVSGAYLAPLGIYGTYANLVHTGFLWMVASPFASEDPSEGFLRRVL
jgi:hypothetical protein